MTKDPQDQAATSVPPLTETTDFYRAWTIVNAAEAYPSTVRARAFAIWVALFNSVDEDGIVKLNAIEVAEEFSVSRASWQHYRKVLSEVGLLEQSPVDKVTKRRSVRLLPPVRS